MTRTPEQARSYALIIGASEYDDRNYGDRPTISASAKRFSELIASPDAMWGLDPGNVTLLDGNVKAIDALKAIREEARRTNVDGLFVYLSTHGRIWEDEHVPDRNLHFAFSDAEYDLPFTHLPFLEVRRLLTTVSKAADIVLVIDSCFAHGAFLGASPPAVTVPSIPGICTLVATKLREPADAKLNDDKYGGYPAFSGALIKVIEQGIRGPQKWLTPDAIFPRLCDLLRANHPAPDMRVRGTSVFLCRNKAYQSVRNELKQSELLARLDRAESVDPAMYATAVENAHGARADSESAERLIDSFGEKRTAREILQLAGLLRSRAVPGLADHADRLVTRVYACRSSSEIADLIHLLHRQDGDDLDDRVLTVLSSKKEPRPAQVLTGVSTELKANGCADCGTIARRLDVKMLGAWPPSRVGELLGAIGAQERGERHDR